PKCLEACTDALVSATFNVSMSSVNFSTAIKLYKCNDENCLSTESVKNVLPAIDSKSINDHRWLKIFNTDKNQALLPNSLYKVVLSSKSAPDVKSGLQLWSLANINLPESYSKPFNEEFTWRFRTKKEACAIDRVEVNPKVFTAQKLDDKAVFVAQPYSSPDACSAFGQKLNPFKSNWSWSSSDLAVASVKSFITIGHSPYCTSNCLLTGSNIFSGGVLGNYPVCGNNKLEAGEDCLAPDKNQNCGLNCLNIIKTKKGSQINTDSKDVNASICGNGLVGVDEDCDLGIAADPTVSTSAMFCGANCLHLGTSLSSAWCKDHKLDKGGFSAEAFNQACVQSISRCGDGVQDFNEDPGCDLGNGQHLNTCDDRCLLLANCTPGPDNPGCSPDKQLQGSSLLYSSPSVCGDGQVGYGENPSCEDKNNFVGLQKNLVDPWVLAIGQGDGNPSGEPPIQFSNITGTTNNKSGVGKYEVQCGWSSDLECSSKYNDSNLGVGDDSCCYAKPKLTKVYPGSVDAVANNICINTYIEADFDSVIDANTLPGNLLLVKLNSNSNVCAPGTEKIDTALIADLANYKNLAWYQKIWHKAISFIKDIFGGKSAQASVWCAGSDLASPYVMPDGKGGSKIILQLNQALATTTEYAVVLKPDIKDTKGVRISYGINKPLGWQFITGSKICEVSTVTIDPNHFSFNIANVTTTLVAQAHAQNNQLIIPVPGYSWNYSWGPKVNDFVSLDDTNSNINNITSQNRNGEIDVYASAQILDNKFTKQSGLIGTGRSHIIVFLCENPWPPLNQKVKDAGPFSIFPYEDKVDNNDNFDLVNNIFDNNPIPPSEVVSAGYFNFSTYYCADSGATGNTLDDLPYLKPAVQTGKDILGVTSTAQGSCENDNKKLCSSDSDCALNQYSIYGHTFALSPTNPKICVVNFNGGSYGYYFDSDQASGQPLACSVDSDCDPVKKSDYYIKTGGISTTCKSMSGSKYNLLDLKCSKVINAFSALKRFIFTNNKNGDAIGMQILSNPNHLSARQWFELDKKFSGKGGQGFIAANGLQDLPPVDGYDAVSDGNNVYVNALNFNPSAPNSNAGNLYTNTYLFSINPNANDETKKVFDQIIKNVKFNINLSNDKRCVAPPNGPTADAAACQSDFDCPTFGTCADSPHLKDVCSTNSKQLCTALTVDKCPAVSTPVSCIATNINSSYCAKSPDKKCSVSADCPNVVTPPACVSISKNFKYCSNNTQVSCTGEIGKVDPGCTDGASTGTCEVLTAKVNACADNNNKPCFDLVDPANNGCQAITNPDICVTSTTIANVCANSGAPCAGQNDNSCAPVLSSASCTSINDIYKSCSNDPGQSCDTNSDCTVNELCSAQKDKLQRDFNRLQDMGQILNLLDGYNSAHGNTYPDLKAGTYLTGQTISTWPSWSVLGNAVGNSLPIDPINKLGISGTCASSTGVFCTSDSGCVDPNIPGQKCVLHDPITGWSTVDQRF
ncbi:MAG: hypothetical protein HY979_01285, partial [Candidatus Magasanikbacteria bacterium]|nr:hypothetical protein [Candidatus Magasanikbacteria bacterium]